MSHSNFTVFAPAKLNLFLHITGKQVNGYHALQSLIGFVDVGDELSFAKHDSLYIDVTGPFADQLGSPRDNLVYKAALRLSEHYKVPAHAKITLTKNLPIAAGIGGGSSDAAATLKGLVKLWGLPDESQKLEMIAKELGADVPVCLYKKLVWVEGIGEKMARVPDIQGMHFVLVNPMVSTLTAEVFKNFSNPFSSSIQYMGRRKTSAEWIADLKMYRNDLTDAAITVTSEIREVLRALEGTAGCLLHRLSGSGATCFGIYGTAEGARIAAAALRNRYPDWWVVEGEMLP